MSKVHYGSEVRFGVVMYGGVSLAIYINGVANELFELCCATPSGTEPPPPSPGGSRAVYRSLSQLLMASAAEREAYLRDGRLPAAPLPVRFCVDVIAGTSAGGINGLFLAKALTQGRSFAPLADLWVREGDIGQLLNDGASARISFSPGDGRRFELDLRANDAPRSLLNSQRMYLKLLEALQQMDHQPPHAALVDELDCHITTTDIAGAPVPLRLSDRVVLERRHRQVFRFRARAGGRNDFQADQSPFLAFASRCTSSFPFAFEPMTLDAARDLVRRLPGQGGFEFAARDCEHHFLGLGPDLLRSGAWRQRAFGDGGYLANKPFGLAARALARRAAGPEVQRVLLYVEPSPEHPEGEPDAPIHALNNATAALLKIPQYQTIREDLDAVLARNERIERVERIVRAAELDIERSGGAMGSFARIQPVNDAVPNWEGLDLSAMVAYYGRAFLPYRRLRVHSVSDQLTWSLCDDWAVDRDSDLRVALRAVVWAWRSDCYVEYREEGAPSKPTINRFLADYDLEYRLRRLRFLQQRTHRLWLQLRQPAGAPTSRGQYGHYDGVLVTRWHKEGGGAMDAALAAAFDALRRGLNDCVAELIDHKRKPLTARERARAQLHAQLERLLSDATHAGGDPQRQRAALFDAAADWFRGSDPACQDLRQALRDDLEARAMPAASRPGSASLKALLGQPGYRLDGEAGRKKVVGWQVAEQVADAALNSAAGRRLRHFMAEAMLRYDEYDQASFPLYYDTDTGEAAVVRVLRISPEDATALSRQPQVPDADKLCGEALAHFGAFLRAEFREHDILWGRLDGAERLIAAVLPEPADEALRTRLVQQAQAAILHEVLPPRDYAQLVDAFEQAFKALRTDEGQALQQRLQQLIDRPTTVQAPDASARLVHVLRALMEPERLRQWFRTDRPPKPGMPKADDLLGYGSRALRISGEMLKAVEQQHLGRDLSGVWLARAGLLLQGLLTVSTPGSLNLRLARHWLLLAAVLSVLMAGLGWFLGLSEVRNGGVALLLATGGFGVLVKALARWRAGMPKLLRGLVVALLAGGLGLAVYGGYTLSQKLVPRSTQALPGSA